VKYYRKRQRVAERARHIAEGHGLKIMFNIGEKRLYEASEVAEISWGGVCVCVCV